MKAITISELIRVAILVAITLLSIYALVLTIIKQNMKKTEKNIVDWGGIYRPIMEEQGIKPAQLCRLTGIPKATMSRILSLKTNEKPSADNRYLIENALNIKL